MLVTRQHDSEQNSWSKSRYETPLHKSTSGSRMSHHYDTPLSTQSDWQGQQYSYLPSGDSSTYSQSYEHGQASHGDAGAQVQPRSTADASGAMDIDARSDRNTLSPVQRQRRSEDPTGLRTQGPPAAAAEHPICQGGAYAQKITQSTTTEGSVTPAETSAMSMGSNPVSSVSSAGQSSPLPSQAPGEDQVKQEDDEEELDDDDIDVEGDGITAEMTPAERTAARRKMKRFRYESHTQADGGPTANEMTDSPTNKHVS